MQLRYGDSSLTFDPPETINWIYLEKESLESDLSQEKIINDSVKSLIQQIKKQKIYKGDSVLLIVPDHTRRCQLSLVLPLLIGQLKDFFDPHIRILVANGSHVLQPDHIVRDLVGPQIYDFYEVVQHDCHDQSSLVNLGTSSNGTPFLINRWVKESQIVITIGGILYHYFAGFGGGPKMLFPGVAGYESIRANHRRTIEEKSGHFHPRCFDGNLDTNPVFTDLAEIAQFVPNCLSLQLALNFEGHITYAETGPILKTHRKVANKVKEMYSYPLAQKADVVVASAGGFPSDVNLIQSHKSIHHAFQAVKKGGYIVMLAECREGIGSKTFLPYLDEGSAQQIGIKLLNDYQINGHTALALKSKAEQTTILFISRLDKEIVRKTGMIPVDGMDEALSYLDEKLEKGATGYIMPKASLLVPCCTDS